MRQQLPKNQLTAAQTEVETDSEFLVKMFNKVMNVFQAAADGIFGPKKRQTGPPLYEIGESNVELVSATKNKSGQFG